MTRPLDLTADERRERGREASRIRQRRYRREKRVVSECVYVGGHRQFIEDGHRDKKPPEAVLAERDRVYAAPITLNMLCFGDPRPGRRAIDQRDLP
jgi:hypothetical protein